MLVLLTLLLYAPSLRSGLVYDAQLQIEQQDFIHTRSNFLDVLTFRVMARDVLDFNRPVHLASLMVDSLFWGRDPFGYHLTNNLLHAANVLLLFLFLCRTAAEYLSVRRVEGAETGALAAAAIGAAMFAVHPLCTEVVAEPSYREDLLAGLFMLMALVLAGGWSGRWKGRDALAPIGILLCALLSIGSKEIGVATMPLLMVYWLTMRWRTPAKPWLILLAGCLTIAGLFTIARFALEPEDSFVFHSKPQMLGGSLANALLIQARIWLLYLIHIFWPANLSADYTAYAVRPFKTPYAITGVALFLVMQALGAWKNRLLLLSAALFWLTLLPASNLLPQYRPIADRYMYVPMFGMGCTLAALLAWAWPHRPTFKAACVLSVACLIALAVACIPRQKVFSNSMALWTDALAKDPESWTAADNLGWAMYEARREAESLKYFEKSLNLTQGKQPDPWVGAALAFERLNLTDKAEEMMKRAIDVNKEYADAELLFSRYGITQQQAERARPILRRIQASSPK